MEEGRARDLNALIGERVRCFRSAAPMTLYELAEALPRQISMQQLGAYERGEARWPADLLQEIAAALKVDIRLLYGTDSIAMDRKGGAAWQAERYKNMFLAMPMKNRQLLYRVIDCMLETNI